VAPMDLPANRQGGRAAGDADGSQRSEGGTVCSLSAESRQTRGAGSRGCAPVNRALPITGHAGGSVNAPCRSSARTPPVLTALLIGLLGSAAACSSEEPSANGADRVYTTRVIEHHAQTLQILDLALGRPGVSVDLGAVADTTRREMFSEANKATRRLRTWHARVPATALEHHEIATNPHYDQAIPGMLSARELASLQHTRNGKFVVAWLDRLISHEAGAVQLARVEVAEGSDRATLAAADADVAQHRHRLAALRGLRRHIHS